MTPEEVQEMINQSIASMVDKPAKPATIISAALKSAFLVFYAHGIFSMISKIK